MQAFYYTLSVQWHIQIQFSQAEIISAKIMSFVYIFRMASLIFLLNQRWKLWQHMLQLSLFSFPSTVWSTNSGNSYKYIVADKQYKWNESYICEKERGFCTG